MNLYPLRFEPLLRRYVWGGHRLGQLLRKSTGEATCAESWELCDRGADQSRISHGPLAGVDLHTLVVQHGQQLLGRAHPQPAFPLLLKFLDAREKLSVQVHPDDARAAQLIPPDRGKTEAWVVLDADPGSRIYAGLRRGFDRATLARETARGMCEACLHWFEPRPGDCIFLPAGTVHALGAGLLVAELQQASDTTYRLWDWNRLGTDGLPRPLHVAQALEALDDRQGPVTPCPPVPLETAGGETLVACAYFVWQRWRLSGPRQFGGDNRCRSLAVIEGRAQVAGDAAPGLLERGDTLLLPAACGVVEVCPEPGATLLVGFIP